MLPQMPDFGGRLIGRIIGSPRRRPSSLPRPSRGSIVQPSRSRRPSRSAGGRILCGLRRLVLAAALIPLALGPARADLPGHRVALVIGNNRYVHLDADRQLLKAVNDANAVGDALQRDGFTVLRGANLTRSQVVDRLYELSAMIQPGDTALFYFAGHGVALGSGNYLLPSDVPDIEQGQEQRLAGQSVAEADIIATLQEKGARVTVMILDACRDNPFKKPGLRSIGLERGFGRMPEANGVFSLYSAGYGQSALDRLSNADSDPNSVFTRVLVPLLTRSGLNLDDLAYNVREQVAQLASTTPDHHSQIPAAYDQIIGGRVYLASVKPDDAAPDAAARPETDLAAPPASQAAVSPPASPVPHPVAPEAAAQPLAQTPAQVATRETPARGIPISDPIYLREIGDRLFDQGFDPGEPGSPAMTEAIRAFETRAGLPASDQPTGDLLDSLRAVQPPSPWGAIAFGPQARRFGLSWSLPTRREALEQARAHCAPGDCDKTVTFSVHRCGALAASASSYFIAWHEDDKRARAEALHHCDVGRGICRVIGAVCADGSGRVSMLPPDRHQP